MRISTISKSAFALALMSSAAIAADLPSRKMIEVAPVKKPVFTSVTMPWTGFYAGLNMGFPWGRFTHDGLVTNRPVPGFRLSPGVQLGAQHQVGSFVYGVEADAQYAPLNDRADVGGLVLKDKVNYYGTIRGRAGVVFNNTLFYATGGFAAGHMSSTFGALRDNNTHTGWAAGAGLEHAFSRHMSLKIEYMYVDLMNKRYFGNSSSALKQGAEFSIARIGTNWRF